MGRGKATAPPKEGHELHKVTSCLHWCQGNRQAAPWGRRRSRLQQQTPLQIEGLGPYPQSAPRPSSSGRRNACPQIGPQRGREGERETNVRHHEDPAARPAVKPTPTDTESHQDAPHDPDTGHRASAASTSYRVPEQWEHQRTHRRAGSEHISPVHRIRKSRLRQSGDSSPAAATLPAERLPSKSIQAPDECRRSIASGRRAAWILAGACLH